MADNPQPDGLTDIERVQAYQKTVLEYEALDERSMACWRAITARTETMSDDDYERYRDLADRRDQVYNRLKVLERQIFQDDES